MEDNIKTAIIAVFSLILDSIISVVRLILLLVSYLWIPALLIGIYIHYVFKITTIDIESKFIISVVSSFFLLSIAYYLYNKSQDIDDNWRFLYLNKIIKERYKQLKEKNVNNN